jgi:small subunit ribosomal protein S17
MTDEKVKKAAKSEEEEEKVEETEEEAEQRKMKTVLHAEEIEKVQAKKKVKIIKKVAASLKKRKAEAVEYTGRNIGIEVEYPTRNCTDANCPFHGKLSLRGQIITGVCVTDRMPKTCVIQRERTVFVKQFERYEKRTTRIAAHNPDCLGIKMGDQVKIMECRPISKTVSFVIIGRV